MESLDHLEEFGSGDRIYGYEVEVAAPLDCSLFLINSFR